MNRNLIKTAGIPVLLLLMSFLFTGSLMAKSEFLSYQWYKNGKAIYGATGPTYTIESADTDDGGIYTVEVINRAGVTTSEGAQVTVEGGTPPEKMDLLYQWYKNGKVIYGAIEPTYTIEEADRDDAGIYTVKVINRLGVETSAEARVTVSGDFAYQWYKDGKAIPGATGQTYVIDPAAVADSGAYTVQVSNEAGSEVSDEAVVTVANVVNKPSIVTQPKDQTVTEGNAVTFSVTANGTAPLSYQWYKNGEAIPDATGSSYTIGKAQLSDAGNYTVTVSNSAGSVTSSAAKLTVNTVIVKPTITTQPKSQTVIEGNSVTFSVTASGTAPLSYQWKKNGSNISGATASSYTISSAKKSDEGSYTVTVSNSAGSVTSGAVTLTVDPKPAAKATISMKSVSSAFVTYGDSCGENAGEKVGSEIIGSLLYNGKEIARQTFAFSSKGLPTGKLNGDIIETDLVPAGANVTLQLAAFDQGYLDHPDTGEYYYGISEPFTYHTGDSNDISPDKYLEYSSFTIEWRGDPNKPTIIKQPVSQTVNEGDPVTFSVVAEGGAAGNADFSIPLSSNVNLDMVWIEPGTFLMGSPKDELGRSGDETLHQVTLTKGYWIGKYEVTQSQYKAITGNEPSYFKGADLPVEQVSWNEAMDFCAKLTAIEKAAGRLPAGYEYTLPTEAQWEYACRAGTTTALNSGKNLTNTGECPEMDEVGWYSGNGNATTHPVGQKKPNNWGLYDMHGNVHEWCLDGRGDYPSAAVTDPVAPSTGKRVGRGSGWMNGAAVCRSAYRFSNDENYNSYNDGFRVALVLVDASAAQPVAGDSLKYQWFKDGKAIEGATDASYTINSAKKSDEGSYYVVVSNTAGSVSSDVATLTVKQSIPDGTAARSVKVDGQTATVTLKLLPNDAVNVYFVEETVPAVGTITPNNGGVYTASKNVIRWSFLDGMAREISYTVAVPSDFNKEVTVSGEVTFDTTVRAITGDNKLDFRIKTHPADTNEDFEITTPEVSLYAVAWKLGQDWSREPVDIPMNYVARGALIWINGGDYIYDSSKAKPACWVNTVKAASVEMASASTNERKINVANGKAYVAIEIVPAEDISIYLVEEQLPADVILNVTDISDGGNYIPEKNVIRWSFLDGEARTLTYTIEPEAGFDGVVTLNGEVMFDEETFTTEGDTEANFGGVPIKPTINFVVEGDGTTLVLDFVGTLYESDDAVNWRIVEGAKAPFTVDITKGKKFYRCAQ